MIGDKRRAMIFSKSMVLADEEIERAVVPAPVSAFLAADDLEFIENLKAGSAEAFETLIDLYSGDIYALLYRLTGNAEEAADLTQDTFLRALRSIKSFRGESGLKTWLFRVAINESRNRYRWWKRRKRDMTISLDASVGESNTPLSDTMADRSISPEEEVLRREREYALTAALLELPDIYREAIVLCDIQGSSYEETAVALGVSLGTVKSRISRGRSELRRMLKDF